MSTHPETGREESESERIDRNLQEMIGELRVALPGVQVLFAFLLVVPFNQRFADVTSLIAPSAHHRIEFRQQDKEHIVRTGNRIIILGLGLLAVAMTGAVVFITDVLYKDTTVYLVGASAAAAFAIFWFVIPLRRMAVGAGR